MPSFRIPAQLAVWRLLLLNFYRVGAAILDRSERATKEDITFSELVRVRHLRGHFRASVSATSSSAATNGMFFIDGSTVTLLAHNGSGGATVSRESSYGSGVGGVGMSRKRTASASSKESSSFRAADYQRCDVYSFGIILHEIFGRQGPWGRRDLSYRDVQGSLYPINPYLSTQSYYVYYADILSRLLHPNPKDPSTRPPLSALSACPAYILQCAQDCWREDPTERPSDFRLIRHRLGELQAGL